MAYRTDTEIAARILELLGDRRQADLATAAGMSESAMSKALHGRRRFTLPELAAVAEFLGTDPLELLVNETAHEFVFRADADQATLEQAAATCRQLIDGYLLLDALVGAG